MENQKKNGFEKPIEDEIKLPELMSVEGGSDTDSDEDWCIVGQCYENGEKKTCYTGAWPSEGYCIDVVLQCTLIIINN